MYTKREAGYRKTRWSGQTCDRCRYYVDVGRTGQCDIVRGTILPEDTCDLWEPIRTPFDRPIYRPPHTYR